MSLQDIENKLYHYDIECFAHDFLVVFRKHTTEEEFVFWNDLDALKEFLNQDMVLCGYNNKHYDQYVLKAFLAGLNPKEMSDFIFREKRQGWEYEPLRDKFVPIPPQIDLMQDTLGLSLKEIEGNIGWNIKETEVDFNLDRPLYPHEKEQTIEYCKCDVKILPKLWELRKDYINAKVTLCEMSAIPLEVGLGLTNAKLTAKFLKAEKTNVPSRRDFDYTKIPNVDWSYIPMEVLEYFDRIQDYNISDEEFESGKLNISIANVPHIVALGGLHGAINNIIEESNEDEIILNYDVALGKIGASKISLTLSRVS